MKQGEMSIGVVVGLALALIILIVLMTLIITRFNLFNKGSGEIEKGTDAQLCAKQGSCRADENPCAGKAITPPASGWIDCAAVCCKP